MESRQIQIRKPVNNFSLSYLLYILYGLQYQIINYLNFNNTIFSNFNINVIKNISLEKIIQNKLNTEQKNIIIQLFLISLVLAHSIALIIQVIVLIQTNTQVYATSVSINNHQQKFIIWSTTFLIVSRVLEIIGIVLKQKWGWYLTQFTYLSVFPLILFYSFVTPNTALIAETTIYGLISLFLYLNPVRNTFFNTKKSFFKVLPIAMIFNTVYITLIEIVKTSLF